MTLKTQAVQTALSGNWEKAIDINKSLIKEDPSDIDALNRLAFAFTILGKTKIIELINIAQSSFINTLRTGQSLKLLIKRLKIFVVTENNKYVGVLPDNIGKRLIKFMKAGNQYEAYVKSALDHHMIAFIREVKRVTRFKDQPSFLSSLDKAL